MHITELDAQTLLGRFNFLKNELHELKQLIQPKQPTEYLSRKAVADLFGVSLVTVNDWTQKNILQAYRIGNRVYYKRHEIEAALQEIKARK